MNITFNQQPHIAVLKRHFPPSVMSKNNWNGRIVVGWPTQRMSPKICQSKAIIVFVKSKIPCSEKNKNHSKALHTCFSTFLRATITISMMFYGRCPKFSDLKCIFCLGCVLLNSQRIGCIEKFVQSQCLILKCTEIFWNAFWKFLYENEKPRAYLYLDRE